MPNIGKASEYLLELLRCAANGTKAKNKPEDVQWREVFLLANRHSASALAYYALKESSIQLDPTFPSRWTERYSSLLVKGSNQTHELKQISETFSREKIKHMPLKGSCLRELFVQPELREMADLDILVPCDMLQSATEALISLGYSAEHDNGNHITFKKMPYLYVEIHRELVDTKYEFYSMFQDPWSLAKPTEKPYRFELPLEESYLYMLAHAAKHYYYQGTGIRSVLDVYMFRREYAHQLNWEYIERRMELPLLRDFAKQIEVLADEWFDPAKQNICLESEMAHYILNSATYGTRDGYDQRIVRKYMQAGQSEKKAKRSFFFRMVFLPKDEMKVMFPILEKAPILLPFCWIGRWIRILVCKPANILKRYKQAKNVDIYKKEEN